jgi:chromosome segregation ATPase
MSDRNLEELIFQLQKLNTENGVKQLVEEAAQLFSKGRHMEAGALLEKAEAIISTSAAPPVNNRPSSTPAGHLEQTKVEERGIVDERPRVDEQTIANMSGKLADSLSKILTGAFQEMERHIIGESHKISASLEQQLNRLQATTDNLVQLDVKFEQLAEAVSEQKLANAALVQKQDQVSGKVTAIEETVTRHQTELGALRGEITTLRVEAKDFSAMTAQQIDGVTARLGLHQEELDGLKSNVSEISRKVSGIIERLDFQAEVIRSLNETQARRSAALDELLGVLTRLKAPAEKMVAAAGGQF